MKCCQCSHLNGTVKTAWDCFGQTKDLRDAIQNNECPPSLLN